MNPRQRRGVLLLGAALLGAVVVFVSITRYVASGQAKVGPMDTVLQLSRDVDAYKPVPNDAVVKLRVPRHWEPESALHSLDDVTGKVAAAKLTQGSFLQHGSLVPPPALRPGEREVAISVDAASGVAGKITRGDVVDIYATFPAANNGSVQPRSQIIVAGARIMEVGTPATQRTSDQSGGFSEGKFVPVTFAVSLPDSLVLTYAESFATKVRLGLLAPGDNGSVPPDEQQFSLTP
jgi:pilus assembly protein CpaB